jgi:hypothetical protein
MNIVLVAAFVELRHLFIALEVLGKAAKNRTRYFYTAFSEFGGF